MSFLCVWTLVNNTHTHTHTHHVGALACCTEMNQAFHVMVAANWVENICRKISHKASRRLKQMGPSVSERNMELQLELGDSFCEYPFSVVCCT